MITRLGVRSRAGRFARSRGSSSGGGGGGSTDFFGTLSPLVEIWAEDPGVTPPSSGATFTNWRDNGSVGGNWVGGNSVEWVDGTTEGINSKPAFDFRPGSGCVVSAPAAGNAPPYTVIAVSMFAGVSGSQYIHDDSNSGQDSVVYLSGGNLNLYATGGALSITGSALAINTPYVTVGQFATNNGQLWLNGASEGTDVSGTPGTPSGFKIGASYGNSYGIDGYIAYAAVFSGVRSSIAGFDAYESAIMSYYGAS